MASLNNIANRTDNLERTKANTESPNFTGKLSIIQDNDSIVLYSNNQLKCCMGLISRGEITGIWNATNGYVIGINNSGGAFTTSTFTAAKIYNAVWNDYAEFYERGEYTEPGDIIGLNPNLDKEEYIKAINKSTCVGVHSDEYGHLIGGEKAPDDEDFVNYNLKNYIPVGLVGRVKTKIVGQISMGDKVVLSNIAGVGRKYIKGIDSPEDIIGMAVENKLDETISRIRVHLRMGGGAKTPFYWN